MTKQKQLNQIRHPIKRIITVKLSYQWALTRRDHERHPLTTMKLCDSMRF